METPDTSGFMPTTVLNTKIGEVENKIHIPAVYWLQLFLIQKLVKLRIKFLIMVNSIS